MPVLPAALTHSPHLWRPGALRCGSQSSQKFLIFFVLRWLYTLPLRILFMHEIKLTRGQRKSVILKYSKLRAQAICKYHAWRVCIQTCTAVARLLRCAWLFVTPWTVTCQAPLPIEFSRQEHCSELPFPSPRDLPDSGIKPVSPILAGGVFTTEPPGKAIDVKQLLKISRKQYTTRMLHFTLTDLFINMFLGASKLALVTGCPQREVLTAPLRLSYEDTCVTLPSTQATFWATSGVDGAGWETLSWARQQSRDVYPPGTGATRTNWHLSWNPLATNDEKVSTSQPHCTSKFEKSLAEHHLDTGFPAKRS